MAFPQPKPQTPQLPNHLLRTIDCQQGAIRAVRFNGWTTHSHSKSHLHLISFSGGLSTLSSPQLFNNDCLASSSGYEVDRRR